MQRVCRCWREGAALAWAQLAPRRWRWHSDDGDGDGDGGDDERSNPPLLPPLPDKGSPPDMWRAYARARCAADARVLQLLRRAASRPAEAEACLREIASLRGAARDALERAAAWGAPPQCLALRHWARAALAVSAGAAAERRVAALLSQPEWLRRPDEAMFEAALAVARVFRPLGGAEAVRARVAAYGAELRRRLAAAGAAPGSEAALALLNELMFAPPAAEDEDEEEMETDEDAEPAQRQANGSGGGGSRGDWGAAAADDAAELRGPAPAALPRVPPPGRGLGLKGDAEDYYSVANSLPGDALARRRGLPMTLALLHMAVGRAAGLDVRLVNLPGHIVNLVTWRRAAAAAPQGGDDGAGGGGGGGGGDEDDDGVARRWVDCFAGGRVLREDEVDDFVLGTLHLMPSPDLATRPAAPAQIVARILANLAAAEARAGFDATARAPLRAAGAPLAAWRLLAALRVAAAAPALRTAHLAAELLK